MRHCILCILTFMVKALLSMQPKTLPKLTPGSLPTVSSLSSSSLLSQEASHSSRWALPHAWRPLPCLPDKLFSSSKTISNTTFARSSLKLLKTQVFHLRVQRPVFILFHCYSIYFIIFSASDYMCFTPTTPKSFCICNPSCQGMAQHTGGCCVE